MRDRAVLASLAHACGMEAAPEDRDGVVACLWGATGKAQVPSGVGDMEQELLRLFKVAELQSGTSVRVPLSCNGSSTVDTKIVGPRPAGCSR